MQDQGSAKPIKKNENQLSSVDHKCDIERQALDVMGGDRSGAGDGSAGVRGKSRNIYTKGGWLREGRRTQKGLQTE